MPTITIALDDSQLARVIAAWQKDYRTQSQPTPQELVAYATLALGRAVQSYEFRSGLARTPFWIDTSTETPEQQDVRLRTRYALAVHRRLSEFAATREYLSMEHCMAVATDTKRPSTAAEGTRMVLLHSDWRAGVKQVLTQINNGSRPVAPTEDELIAELEAAVPLTWA
jgi:hypothetical protein